MVGRGGFEPPKVRTTRFTVWPIWPLWNLPLNPIACPPRADPQPRGTRALAYAVLGCLSETSLRAMSNTQPPLGRS